MASMADLPPVPPAFKPLQHYVKTALEHEKRDLVITYYCLLYALQLGMKINSKAKECYAFLSSLMSLLENMKQQLQDNESIRSEVVGQAHVENYALKMFLWADTEDRACHFNKNVVKSFYTAGMLFDVLQNFGELTDEIESHRKYAKWKAAYIHNCLKNGEVPHPGPIDSEDDEINIPVAGGGVPGTSSQPHSDTHLPSELSQTDVSRTRTTNDTPQQPVAAPRSTVSASEGAKLGPSDFARAQKLCKFAGSAIQYEDVTTAVENLQKCLKLLTTGSED